MDLIKIFKEILKIRAVENKIDYLFKRGLINGTAHFCIGQEFIPVIISQYLTKEDIVTSTHRGHGHAISKGVEIKEFLAELMGKKSGCNLGKGGSQHIISREKNFYTNGITGGMIPIATGMAFSNKYQYKKNVVVAYLGDGGFNEGYVMESLNIAGVMKLPILIVCENNMYAMSTHIKKSHSSEIINKVKAFGIKSELIEDNDYIKLNKIAKEFIDNIRENKGPYFIEVRTYRHKGHSKNDLNLYRDKEEEKYWFDRDVLIKIEQEIINKGLLKPEEIEDLKLKVEKEIDEITQEIIMDSEENSSKILNHIYSEDD